MNFLVQFLGLLIPILELAIIGRIIVSWIDPTGQYRISQVLRDLTEPIIAPIRRIVPSMVRFVAAGGVFTVVAAGSGDSVGGNRLTNTALIADPPWIVAFAGCGHGVVVERNARFAWTTLSDVAGV